MASLKRHCETCNKEVKGIEKEFPLGRYINYVWKPCGHLEVILKTVPVLEEINSPFGEGEDETKELKDLYDEFQHETFDYESPMGRFAQELNLANSLPPQAAPKGLLVEEPLVETKSNSPYASLNNKMHAYPYQVDGVRFIESTDFNCLIADEMGLGKTIQALIALKRNLTKCPALIIVKGATLFNWPREIQEWVSKNPFDCCIVQRREDIFKGFKFYIISMDLISRKGVLDLLLALDLECVVIDECQNFKDASSKRTIALIKLIQNGNIAHKICLSGTPIKNRANEYFVILNLLDPARFTSYIWFCREWLITDEKGVYTRINPLQEERFKRVTSKYILRRETKDVQRDLPELRINYQLVEIEDEALKKSYNYQLDLFQNFLKESYNSTLGLNSTELLGWLAKLRKITGQAKCKNAVDFVREFVDSNESDKIAVGIHHQNVRDTLKLVFKHDGMEPESLSGEDSNWEKQKIADTMNKDPNKRVLIINIIAGGQGLNLQGINNFVSLERQWNSADEDQFHKRFHRDGQKKTVTGTYLIARGTIDEFFHEMVWKKRNNIASAGIGDGADETQGIGFLKEFSEFVVRHKI